MTAEDARALAARIRLAAPAWGPDSLMRSALELADALEECPSVLDQAEIFRMALRAIVAPMEEDGPWRTVYVDAVRGASLRAWGRTWDGYGLQEIAAAALDLCGDIP